MPGHGFICPVHLPQIPEFQLVCEDGCYLFHPIAAKDAKINADKVKLIPDLQAERDEALTQRDGAIADKMSLEEIRTAQGEEIVRLNEEIESRYTLGVLLGVGGGGLVVGTLAGVLIMAFAK